MDLNLNKAEIEKSENNGKKYSIVSFTCGICGMGIFALGFLGLIPSVLAIIFANAARRAEPRNKLRTAGFVLGIIGLVYYASQILSGFIACALLLNILGNLTVPLY